MSLLGIRDGVYYHYLRLVMLTTDWETLAEIAEQFESDARLTTDEKDRLLLVVDAREIIVRPWLSRREST